MIVSHAHEFIFVKPRKVAGTTIELMLSNYLKDGDLATPIEPHEEYLRSCQPGVLVGKISRKQKIGLPFRLRDHSTLERAYLVLGRQVRNYFIITACRNPWDRAVSQFFWSFRNQGILQKDFRIQKREFNKFTKQYGPNTWLNTFYGRKKQRSLNSSHLYSINSKILANFVIRYEFLEKDFLTLTNYLKLPKGNVINNYNTKSEFRPKGSRVWQSFYDKDTIDLVGECCSDEIKYFNYNFEGTAHSTDKELYFPSVRL